MKLPKIRNKHEKKYIHIPRSIFKITLMMLISFFWVYCVYGLVYVFFSFTPDKLPGWTVGSLLPLMAIVISIFILPFKIYKYIN